MTCCLRPEVSRTSPKVHVCCQQVQRTQEASRPTGRPMAVFCRSARTAAPSQRRQGSMNCHPEATVKTMEQPAVEPPPSKQLQRHQPLHLQTAASKLRWQAVTHMLVPQVWRAPKACRLPQTCCMWRLVQHPNCRAHQPPPVCAKHRSQRPPAFPPKPLGGLDQQKVVVVLPVNSQATVHHGESSPACFHRHKKLVPAAPTQSWKKPQPHHHWHLRRGSLQVPHAAKHSGHHCRHRCGLMALRLPLGAAALFRQHQWPAASRPPPCCAASLPRQPWPAEHADAPPPQPVLARAVSCALLPRLHVPFFHLQWQSWTNCLVRGHACPQGCQRPLLVSGHHRNCSASPDYGSRPRHSCRVPRRR